MKVVWRERLEKFCAKHADAKDWIGNWLADVESVAWTGPRDIKANYASASFLSGNTVIFNVKGNHYRLEVVVAYGTETIVVVWAGTHVQYDARNRKRH